MIDTLQAALCALELILAAAVVANIDRIIRL